MRPTAQIFWSIVYKIFPIVRNSLLFVGLIWHKKIRQPFTVGYLKEGIELKDCQKYLKAQGFERNVLAWIDDGEVLSMRKIDPIQPHRHYHIRIFNDGEVCGHYEKMPERHPIDCLRKKGMENRSIYFRSLMAEFLIDVTKSPFSGQDIYESLGNFFSHKSQISFAKSMTGPSKA